MTRWTLVLVGLGWLLACSGAADIEVEPIEPVPTEEPEPVADSRLDDVRTIYDRYQTDDAPTRKELPLSAGLKQAWIRAKDDVDFDPVIDGQDYEVSDIEVALDGDDVVATFLNFGNKQTVRWVMIEEDGRWVADDLRGKGWSLSEMTKK